jgi:hypothetical protein
MKSSIKVLSAGIAAAGLALGAFSASAAVPEPATVAAAKTSADHEAIAKSYEEEAAALDKLAATHSSLGETYSKQGGGKSLQAAQAKHCDSVAVKLAAAAKEERALAAEHHKMAKSAGH